MLKALKSVVKRVAGAVGGTVRFAGRVVRAVGRGIVGVLRSVWNVAKAVASPVVKVTRFAWAAWRWISVACGVATYWVVELLTGREVLARFLSWGVRSYVTFLPFSIALTAAAVHFGGEYVAAKWAAYWISPEGRVVARTLRAPLRIVTAPSRSLATVKKILSMRNEMAIWSIY